MKDLDNQGFGNCYQPRLSARMITLTSTLIIADITKTSPIIDYYVSRIQVCLFVFDRS